MKKILIFSVILLVMVFSVNLPSQAQDVPEINMAFMVFGPVAPDLKMVSDELNKKIIPKINAKVKLMPINIGAWGQQTNLMLASGEKLDLMVNGTLPMLFTIGTQIANNQLLPMDDLLLKYGQGIIKSMNKSFVYAGRVNGKLYIIPTVRDLAGDYQFCMRKDIVDELKINISKIKNLDDVEKVLKLVKEKKPDIIPLIPQTAGTSIAFDGYQTYDRLGGYLGVLPDYGKRLKVMNLYELPEYIDIVKRVRKWYQAGLILRDAATNKDDWTVFFKAGKAFSIIAQGKPGFDKQQSDTSTTPIVTATIVPAFTTTDNVVNFGWCIPRNSANPDKAMQLLNLLYTDSEIYNLLVFGMEGKHYVKLPNRTIDYPAGLNGATVGYDWSGLGWQLGNQFIGYVKAGNRPTLWKEMEAFNNSAKKSKAMGFFFDATPVKTETAACQNVLNQYRLGLEDGILDPDKTLPEFNKKLKSAGLDKIIAEKQKQLDAWAKVNGIK